LQLDAYEHSLVSVSPWYSNSGTFFEFQIHHPKKSTRTRRFWMQEMGAAHVGTMAYNQLITAAANAHDLRAAEAVYKEPPKDMRTVF
jgi:hypothetical protein